MLSIGSGPVQQMDDGECLRLLGTARLGRLGYTQGALPAIRPVSFTLQGRCVLIPADLNSPLVSALRGSVVAFSVDTYGDDADGDGRDTGWSVTVVGLVRVLSAADDPRARCRLLVEPGLVSGWRVGAAPRPRRRGPRDAAGPRLLR